MQLFLFFLCVVISLTLFEYLNFMEPFEYYYYASENNFVIFQLQINTLSLQ